MGRFWASGGYMNSTESKKAFRLMVVELAIVSVVVVVAFFCAVHVGMSLSSCLVSLALGVLLGAGLDVLSGRLRRRHDR